MFEKFFHLWNYSYNNEGKILVVLFLIIAIGSFVGVFGILMPYLISAKSTFHVILGFLSPFIWGGILYEMYNIFFKD